VWNWTRAAEFQWNSRARRPSGDMEKWKGETGTRDQRHSRGRTEGCVQAQDLRRLARGIAQDQRRSRRTSQETAAPQGKCEQVQDQQDCARPAEPPDEPRTSGPAREVRASAGPAETNQRDCARPEAKPPDEPRTLLCNFQIQVILSHTNINVLFWCPTVSF
jgi:hypothetical protein